MVQTVEDRAAECKRVNELVANHKKELKDQAKKVVAQAKAEDK